MKTLRTFRQDVFQTPKNVGFANLEDILHSCLKDISYSGISDISQRQFLDILAR